MKIATIIVRILMGLLYLMAAVTYFFNLVEVPPAEGDVKLFNDGIEAAVYLMPLVKTLELLCGLALVVGRYVALTAIVIFPITLNIFLFHAFLAPEAMYMQVFLLLGNVFLFYAYQDKYRPLFAHK
ncbi:MAG TPA: DoxX family membrane protein [Flavobacterium sp.]|jgi:uncharacterized membrane protein YphA (DoxX/SURF4 family)